MDLPNRPASSLMAVRGFIGTGDGMSLVMKGRPSCAIGVRCSWRVLVWPAKHQLPLRKMEFGGFLVGEWNLNCLNVKGNCLRIVVPAGPNLDHFREPNCERNEHFIAGG
ncbi:hypothetical protein AS189_09255 [Arthrobacter alpinus]|uniref:Uncharacterized protein n=1 Tax=Arthrobacter alpinus TaxID=656366 RepID=A0A0S2LYW2_9MICC|nr:hypothetical protein AS189_09255 [Arthrobacter alpinus]